MGRKVFVSYKYSDSERVKHYYRDKLIDLLVGDGNFYEGETSDSPDLTDTTTDNIRRVLRDSIYQTSVTVVFISPSMHLSEWIPWEISYSLKTIKRASRNSRPNGVIGVILPDDFGKYSYFVNKNSCDNRVFTDKLLPEIIKNNRFNIKVGGIQGDCGKTYNSDYGSYISFYEWDTFIDDYKNLIEIAIEKSTDKFEEYKVQIQERLY